MSRSSIDRPQIFRPFATSLHQMALIALLIVGCTLFTALDSHAQTSSSDLKKKRKEIQNKINYTNKLISESRSDQRMSQTELILINQRIALRQEKINTIGYEIAQLNTQVDELNSVIEAMESDMTTLKKRYASMVVFAYKNRDQNDRLLYIFAATDISQAYARLKYMQEYAEARKEQLVAIGVYRNILAGQVTDLEEKKQDRKALQMLELTDKESLALDKVEQQQTLTGLMGKENQLRSKLHQQEKEKEKLNQAIAYAIKKEIEAEKAKNKGVFRLTPEARLVSENFEKNKGRLPWPVERGLITSTFGDHAHPTIPGLKVKNNGIDISTNKGSLVRAVFDGEVISIIVISGAGKTVMLKHGGYYTTYSNLKDVKVKKGDKVEVKDLLGTLLTDIDNKTVAHFEIWAVDSSGALKKENPTLWIYKK
jgi:septal ring factor EnvC (AmiA/AmiB activator)